MLKKDPSFDGANVFVYGYDSPRLGQSLTIGELGSDLKSVLLGNDIFKHKRIAFLMHSMGGLIVRSFLTEYGRENYIKNVKLLYFLATPTEGSQLASIFGLVSRNPEFRDMAPADRANKLGEDLRRWLSARFDIASYCAYETEKTPSGIFGIPDILIVPMTNALALCNRAPDPIQGATHVTIAQPDDQRSRQYVAFRNAFNDAMSASACVLKGVVVADVHEGHGMANIPISVDEEENNAAISKVDGKFVLEFLDKQPGDTVHVRVNMEAYVVVNEVQLEVTIPANPDAKLLTIILCKETDREEMARRFYRLKSSEGIEENYKKQLRELEDKRQATEAAIAKLKQERDQAKAATEKASEDLASREEIARRFYRLQAFDAIEETYRKRLKELEDTQQATDTNLAKLQQERDEARTAAEKAAGVLAKIQPGQTSELYQEAKRFFLDGKIEQAVELLDDEKLHRVVEQTQEAIENAVESWLLKAQLLTVQLRFGEAEKAYRAAIDATPDSFAANFAFARFNQQLNRYDKAEKAYRWCLDWARKGGKNAELATTLNSLGNLDSAQNRPEEARQEFEEALKTYRELAQKNPETHLPHAAKMLDNLGVLDSAQNRIEDARKKFEEALQIYESFAKQDPEQFSPDVKRVKQLLAELPNTQGP